jgi:hypothetical protein
MRPSFGEFDGLTEETPFDVALIEPAQPLTATCARLLAWQRPELPLVFVSVRGSQPARGSAGKKVLPVLSAGNGILTQLTVKQPIVGAATPSQQTVLLVDDDSMVRGWVRLALNESEFRLAGEAATATEGWSSSSGAGRTCCSSTTAWSTRSARASFVSYGSAGSAPPR